MRVGRGRKTADGGTKLVFKYTHVYMCIHVHTVHVLNDYRISSNRSRTKHAIAAKQN